MQGRIISAVAVLLALFILAIVISPVGDIPLTTEKTKGANGAVGWLTVAVLTSAAMVAAAVITLLPCRPNAADAQRHSALFNFTCAYLC